jgi:hypothetical protein
MTHLCSRHTALDVAVVGHAALDVAGMVPVIGEAADVANGLWCMAEGSHVDGALSMCGSHPGRWQRVCAIDRVYPLLGSLHASSAVIGELFVRWPGSSTACYTFARLRRDGRRSS